MREKHEMDGTVSEMNYEVKKIPYGGIRNVLQSL